VSNVLIGIFGTLAVAAVGAALKWGKQALAAIRAKLTPDHQALFQRPAWGLMTVQSDGIKRIRLVIACAPSRSLHRTTFSPDAAIRLICSQFPGRFPDQPATSDLRTGVKFTASPTGSTQDGYAWAWVTGRLDLSTYIQMEPASGRFVVPVMDILQPIAQVADAVASPAYAGVFGSPRWPRPRRFDWFIGISGDLVRDDGGTVPWDDLDFPGRRPQRAGTQQYPYCPTGGFAREQLRSWNPKRPLSHLLQVFLADFLQTNGYHDIDDAITDTIKALKTSHSVSAATAPAQLSDGLPGRSRPLA
jgi:hypothetical protein